MPKIKQDIKHKVASLARLERATHCLEGSCSIHLSYRDVSVHRNFSTCLMLWQVNVRFKGNGVILANQFLQCAFVDVAG